MLSEGLSGQSRPEGVGPLEFDLAPATLTPSSGAISLEPGTIRSRVASGSVGSAMAMCQASRLNSHGTVAEFDTA